VPRAYAEDEKKLMDTMQRQRIIQKSSSPWSSPLVLVMKKNRKIRPCVDNRRLNSVTWYNSTFSSIWGTFLRYVSYDANISWPGNRLLLSQFNPLYIIKIIWFSTIFFSDLGLTNLVEHHIETGHAKPLKQPPRRVPRAYAEDEKKLIDTMQRQRIIQTSIKDSLMNCHQSLNVFWKTWSKDNHMIQIYEANLPLYPFRTNSIRRWQVGGPLQRPIGMCRQ
jgi:hypothetical protein